MINSKQIEHIDVIPESKITMMNGKYYIVRESVEEIIQKEIQFILRICFPLHDPVQLIQMMKSFSYVPVQHTGNFAGNVTN